MVHTNDKWATEWEEAISVEENASLSKAWEDAVSITLSRLQKGNSGYFLSSKLNTKTIPTWIRKGELISLARDENDTEIMDAEIFAKHSSNRTCTIFLRKKGIEQVLTLQRELWILPFSRTPYNLMRNSVNNVLGLSSSKSSLAEELLTEEKVKSRNLTVVQGPPGTGKTTSIGEVCYELFHQYQEKVIQAAEEQTAKPSFPKILLTAFTHKACVNIAETLDKLKVPFVTIDIRGLPPDLHEKYDLKKVTNRVVTKAKEKNSSIKWDRYGATIKKQVLDQSMYIITTAMAASIRFKAKNRPYFQYAIVDEGSQIPMPIMAGIAAIAERTSVFGDPDQLPPVILSPIIRDKQNLRENPLTQTVFNKFPHGRVRLLDRQFRGRAEIFMLISALFYKGRIRTGTYIPPLDTFPPIEFIDSSGSEGGTGTRINKKEKEICQNIIDELATHTHSKPLSVGVISPFVAQAKYLRRTLRSPSPSLTLDIGTVHVSQGRTYDVVIYSLAATSLSPFLNVPREWMVTLKENLEDIFERLSIESSTIEGIGYENFSAKLLDAYGLWYQKLEKAIKETEEKTEEESKVFLSLFEDSDSDIVLDIDELTNLPENDFAPNIFNVAMSRARHRLIVIGNYEALEENVMVSLVHGWAQVFGQVNRKVKKTGKKEKYPIEAHYAPYV